MPRQIQASPGAGLQARPGPFPLYSQTSLQLPANRVFSDRLVDVADTEAFVGIISDKLGSFFDLTFHNLCPNKRSPIFGELGAVAPVGWRLEGDGLGELGSPLVA